MRASLLRHAWAQTALWLVAVVLLGHLSAARFSRVDLTHDQRHSVSEVARRAVSELQRPLIARVYFSGDLQPPYHDHRRVLLDLLDELAAWSSGQLEVRVIDPGDDPTLAAEATRAGIQPVPYVYRAHDRQEARTVYMGVAFQYGERQSAAPALPSLSHLEEEVVRALRRVIVPPDERRAVGWVVGHGEPDPRTLPEGSPLIPLRDELGSTRSLQPVDLARPLPPELDLLLLIAPRERLPDLEQLRLDQHVMEGGALVAFLSGYQPDFQNGRARELDHGLHDLLQTWGLTPERAVILDRTDNERLALPMLVPGSGARWVQVHHPLAPVTTHLDRGHPAVRDLGRLVLPFVTPLAVSDPLPPGVEVEVWAQSGPGSVAVSGEPTLQPSALASPVPDERGGPHTVVAAVSGRLPSRWAGREPPQGSERTAEEVIPVGRPARVVLVGSGDAAANSTDLVLSAVDWALQDPDLLEAVRDRGARDVLEAPDSAVHWRLRLGLTVGPLLLLGLVTLLVRRGLR